MKLKNDLMKLRNRLLFISKKEKDVSALGKTEKLELAKDSMNIFLELGELVEEEGLQMNIIGELQSILGVTELTKMRDSILMSKTA